jgi:multiple sugar transport system ATP-binding protein
MASIELRHLRKVFLDGSVAVHDLSLSVADKEFLTLLGPSGCGKTTTLRMIAGLESPTSGEVLFDGKSVTQLPPAQRNIAMVFQSYALYPHMTVRGNLEYPLRKRGVARSDRASQVESTARLLRIEHLLDRRPRQLSGGQQQRVALGRAIIRDPTVFLLDEPLSNLDAKLRAYMRAELIQLHRRIGKTMIYVTHDQLEAMTMSDRIAVLNEGRIQQLGPQDEVYRRPRNRFVASFLGNPAMNLIDGELASNGDAITFTRPGISLPIEGALASAARAKRGDRSVTLGVRPEDVLLDHGQLAGELTVLEPAGHETLAVINIEGTDIIARLGADVDIAVLSRTPVRFRQAKMHLFDGSSGIRLEAP